MRMRTLKPEFWEDEKLGVQSDAFRLAFEWTWSEADDSGVLRISAGAIRSGVWKHQDRTLAESQEILDRFVTLGLIAPWQDGSATYAAVVHFHDHQRPDHPGKTYHPLIPSEILATLPQSFRDGYARVDRASRDTLAKPSRDSRDTRSAFTPPARDAVLSSRVTEEPSSRGTEKIQEKKEQTPPNPLARGDGVALPTALVPVDKPPAKARQKGVPPTRLPSVLSAFSFWRTTCNHPGAADPDPDGLIARRIDAVIQKHGRPYFDSICRGAAADTWADRRKNDTLDILLREGTQERMRALDPGAASAPAASDNRTDEAKATKLWYDIAKTKPGIEPPQVAIIVDMLGPRTLDALKVIDSNPIRSILCITESSFDEKTRMKREFIQAWIHSGLNDDAEDVDE
jgi:hypothetical protein